MAITASWFGKALRGLFSTNQLNWVHDPVKLALLDQKPDFEATNLSDLSEISGEGYEPGGRLLTNKTISWSAGETRLKADPVSWDDATFEAKAAVVHLDGSLFGWIDFGSEESVTNGKFTVSWGESGALALRLA